MCYSWLNRTSSDEQNLLHMFSTLLLPLRHGATACQRAPQTVSSKLKEATKTPGKAFPKEENAKDKNDKKQHSQGALLAGKCHS